MFLAHNSPQMVAGWCSFTERITCWYICAHPSGLQRLWSFFPEVWVLADLNSRNRPDAFLLFSLFLVYKINSDFFFFFFLNRGWKKRSVEFHFHCTFFLQIVYWRHQTAPGAGKCLQACLRALTCMFRQRQWRLQHRPRRHVSEETISHPSFCFTFVLFLKSYRNTERGVTVFLCLLLTAAQFWSVLWLCTQPSLRSHLNRS